MGHHSGRGTAAAAMVHSVLADDDSYGVFGTSKHTDSYIRNNNRRVKKELQLVAILVAGSREPVPVPNYPDPSRIFLPVPTSRNFTTI